MHSQNDSTDAARHWAKAWMSGWEARDTNAIVALYHPQVRFSSQPFRTPYVGLAGVREYVSRAFAEEEDVRAWVGQPVVDGDRATVEWWAALTEKRGRDHAGGDIGPAL